MKKYTNKIISVLLFAFTFFVMHDYVIEYSPSTSSESLQVTQKHAASCAVSLDTSVDKLHDDIHAMLDTPINHIEILSLTLCAVKPPRKEFSSLSYRGISPNKPPVI